MNSSDRHRGKTRVVRSTVTVFLPIFVLFSAGAMSCGAGEKEGEKTVRLPVGDHLLLVEIADTDAKRAQGLMGRKELPEDRGMLFVFPDSRNRSFWMKDTFVPLSIAYINRHGEILEIYDMEPLSTAAVPSRYPAQYALEVGQGIFEQLGIGPGDTVDLSALPSWVKGR
jgi:hypothetical protein